MDELRCEIFDFLYREKDAKSVDEIASSLGQESDAIEAAIQHEWFAIDDNKVSISKGSAQ
ncbi:MAG: hypothetical protein AB8B91_14125 [Rubripirellula sp.]